MMATAQGDTLMCFSALYYGINTDAAAALIFAGADITATDNTGYSPHCFGPVQAAGANGWARAGARQRIWPVLRVGATDRRSTPWQCARCGACSVP